jgi:hypothetical protein
MRLTDGLASLRLRAAWARGFLLAYIVVAALVTAWNAYLAVMARLNENTIVVTPDGSPFMAAAKAIAMLAGSISLGAITLISPVIILLWIYRAHGNLRTIGVDSLNYSPGWAAGSFFVPIINLVVPFRAMRELCNRSFGESKYQAHESVPDVSSWWTCFVVGNLVQAFLILQLLIELLTPFFFTTPRIANALLGLFSSLLLIGSAFFLFRIIGAVTTAQMSVTGIEETFA